MVAGRPSMGYPEAGQPSNQKEGKAMTLGQRIQELRKAAGLSQEALGERLGVSRQAVSKWEGDSDIPELDTLIAMSRLFSVSLGALLGVEEQSPPPAPAEAPPSAAPALDEARVEAILRRYAAESAHQQGRRRKLLLALLLPAAAGILAAVLFLRGQLAAMSAMEDAVRRLQTELSELEYSVEDQIGGLTWQMRDILEEQNSLVSGFQCSLSAFDPAEETVELELTGALKAYGPDTQVQFSLTYTKADGSQGRAESNWLTGMPFTARVALPMNAETRITLLIRDGSGGTQTQELAPIYDLRPDYFALRAGDTSMGEGNDPGQGLVCAWVESVTVLSQWPDQLWPEGAELVFLRDGREERRWPLTLGGEDGRGVWQVTGGEEKEFWASADSGRGVLRWELRLEDNFGRTYRMLVCERDLATNASGTSGTLELADG